MSTIPDHNSHDRRIQINQVGSWSTMFRYSTERGHTEQVILEAAEELASWDTNAAPMRVLNRLGAIVATWTVKDGWTHFDQVAA